MNLIDKIENCIQNIKSNPFYNPTDNNIRNDIIQILHDHYDGNLLNSFLVIEQLNKVKLQKEKDLLYRGLEDGMHNLTSVCKSLLEDKTSKQAKEFAKTFFVENNLAYIINIAKGYFPKGHSKGASTNGKWFFDAFKALLIKHKDKYLKGGSSYDWACRFEHINYINLVLENAKNS